MRTFEALIEPGIPIANRTERAFFAAFAALMFAYVAWRAVLIPLVHDEATSFLAYAQTGHFMPGASLWDANNHYLNSLCGWIGYRLFGLHLLALRWASVLAYALFAWAAWKLGARLKSPMVRWIFWSALLACPFLLDFFSLFRGYGPAMAFLLLAFHHQLCFVEERRTGQLVRTLLAMMVANGFLLALVPLWAVMLGVLFFFKRKDRAQLAACIAFGFVPIAASALLAFQMARMGLLYQGGTSSFLIVTVGSLMQRVFGSSAFPLIVFAVSWTVIATVAIAWWAVRQRRGASPAFIIASMLCGECLARVLLANTLGINYGEDRTALHTLLLVLIASAFAADLLAGQLRWAWICVLPLLALPLRAGLTANQDHTVLWPEQSIPDRFVLRVQDLERKLGRAAVVGTHRHAGLPWSLQCRMLGGEGDANANAWPHGLDDARIIVPFLLKEAGEGFAVVDSSPGNQLLFLVREPPLPTVVVQDSAFTVESSASVRSTVVRLSTESLRRSDLLVEVDGRISSEADPLELQMALAVYDSTGAMLHGDFIFLNTRRERWKGEAFRTIRPVPRQPTAARAEIFFLAPDRAAYRVEEGRVVVRIVLR